MGEQRALWLRWVDSDDAAALLLALAALGTAWSGYQASIWGGIQSAQYTYSSVLRGKAAARADEVARLRMVDVAMFTKWLDAFVEHIFVGSVRPLVELRWRALMMAIAGLLCVWAAGHLIRTPVSW